MIARQCWASSLGAQWPHLGVSWLWVQKYIYIYVCVYIYIYIYIDVRSTAADPFKYRYTEVAMRWYSACKKECGQKYTLGSPPQKERNEDNAVEGLARALYYCTIVCYCITADVGGPYIGIVVPR